MDDTNQRGFSLLNSSNENSHFEQSVRLLAESLGEGLLVVQAGKIIFHNDLLLQILGWNQGDVTGKMLKELLPVDPIHEDYFRARDRREDGTLEEKIAELRIRLPDGRRVYLKNRATRVVWDGVPATLHLLEDISMRKATERQLLEQKEVNSILADVVRRILASPMSLEEIAGAVLASAMRLTQSQAGILMVNGEGGRRILQKQCSRHCQECAIPGILDKIEASPYLMGQRRPGRIDGAFYLNEDLPVTGTCSDVSIVKNILCVPSESDGPLSALIILADTPKPFGPWDLDSMEKVAEVLSLALRRLHTLDDLRRAKDSAEKQAEARSLFLANVSHEIRSPLNGVLMMASLLEDTNLDEEQQELLGVVKFSARTIDRLIRDLTDLTQIRTGKITIYREAFNLEELCRNILETNRPEAQRKDLSLELVVDPGSVDCVGDRERIGQVVANLVTNAVKYTEKGGMKLETVAKGSSLVITVTDTGVGIPEDQVDAVFGLYHQGLVNGKRRGEGAGIGLAVVKELTEVMGGRVELHSSEGKGSRFLVTLPSIVVRKAVEPPVQGDLPHRARILVAEDEGVNRLYIRTILERHQWIIDEAVDGVEAVQLASRRRYDLVLMDISMPRMDGMEATQKIKEIHPYVPVVAITAHGYEDDRKEILKAGFNDIVLKPIDEGLLQKVLGRYLGTSELSS